MQPARTRHGKDPSQISSPAPSSSWLDLLSRSQTCFTRPSFEIFRRLIMAWVMCPGRHTITRLYLIAEPDGDRARDAYHRFLRAGAWSLERL
jgi:hypothetical protein